MNNTEEWSAISFIEVNSVVLFSLVSAVDIDCFIRVFTLAPPIYKWLNFYPILE